MTRRERVARAIWDKSNPRGIGCKPTWEDSLLNEEYLRLADAATAAMEDEDE